jgi:hypothetical protein
MVASTQVAPLVYKRKWIVIFLNKQESLKTWLETDTCKIYDFITIS